MFTLYLGEQVYEDLEDIAQYTLRVHGEAQVERYMSVLYQGFSKIAADPRVDQSRRDRSFPFHMAPISSTVKNADQAER